MRHLNESIMDSYTTIVCEGVKRVVNESPSTINWAEVKEDFNMVHDVEVYNGSLVHGTPPWNMLNMISNGVELDTHREIGVEAISVSDNDVMLSMFGSSSEHDVSSCGFHFWTQGKGFKIIKLDKFYYDLLAFETGVEGFWDNPDEGDNESMMEMATKMGLVSRFGGFGIDNPQEFYDKVIAPLGIHGMALPGFGDRNTNSESEIAVVDVDKLSDCLYGYDIDGDYYEPDQRDEVISRLGGIIDGTDDDDMERYR